jgi:hypothetical protein
MHFCIFPEYLNRNVKGVLAISLGIEIAMMHAVTLGTVILAWHEIAGVPCTPLSCVHCFAISCAVLISILHLTTNTEHLFYDHNFAYCFQVREVIAEAKEASQVRL